MMDGQHCTRRTETARSGGAAAAGAQCGRRGEGEQIWMDGTVLGGLERAQDGGAAIAGTEGGRRHERKRWTDGAVRGKHEAMVRLLLKHKADVDVRITMDGRRCTGQPRTGTKR